MISIANDVYKMYEGYNIDGNVLSSTFIDNIANTIILPIIENMTGFSAEKETQITEYYSGSGHAVLILNRKPIKSIESIIIVDYNEMINGTVPVSNLEIEKATGIVKIRSNINSLFYSIFPRGKNNIKVSYTVGFTEGSMPQDLKSAIVLMTCKYCLTHIGSKTGGGSLSVDGYSKNFGAKGKWTDLKGEWDGMVMILLNKYLNSGVVSI